MNNNGQLVEKIKIYELVKRFSYIFIPMATIIIIITGLFYYTEAINEKTLIENKADDIVVSLNTLIENDFELIAQSMLTLARGYKMQKMLEEGDEYHKNLVDRFLSFAKQAKVYDQICFLDEKGRELIRIEYNNNNPYSVTKKQLQSESDRSFFLNTFQLDIDEVHISPFYFNMRQGQIEIPVKPIIRFGAPVFDQKGEKRGVLTFNYLGNHLLEDINKEISQAPGEIMLLDVNGFLLKSSYPQNKWCFMYKNKQNLKFGNTFPDAWTRISREKAGEFYTKDGLFAFTTMVPFSEELQQRITLKNWLELAPVRMKSKDYYYKIVSYVPNNILNANSRQVLNKLLKVNGVLLIALAVISWLLASISLIRRQAEKSLKWEVKVNFAMAKLANALLTQASIEDISYLVLEYGKTLTRSEFGYVGYIDLNTGYLIVPTMTREIWNVCQVKDKEFVFKELHGLRAKVLETRKSVTTNNLSLDSRAYGLPEGHLNVNRFLSAPAIVKGDLVGQIAMANADHEYTEKDRGLIERLADLYAIIIQRRQAEESLKESEQRFKDIFDDAPDGIIIFDFEKKHVFMLNKMMCYMLGYAQNECINMPMINIYPGKDISYILEQFEKMTRREITKITDIPIKRKDNSIFYADINTVEITLSGKKYLMGFFRDITERKNAEENLKATLMDLERSNKELEQFAYVASHDLQEPLRKIQAFSDRVKTKWGDVLTEQGRDYLDRMQNAANRMQKLVVDLLTFSRVTTKAQPFDTVNMNNVAREVLSDLESLIQRTGGKVEVENLPDIEADSGQMYQLLQNLIGNALKFHKKENCPFVKVYSKIFEENKSCQIFVQDNGIGFEQKYLERIFVIFQRLHGRDEYEGTGIGLAICKKIVERHGGTITAKSILNEGTTFIITLPIQHYKFKEKKEYE